MTPHYATPPRPIGKHQWRCIVLDYWRGGRCTEYQWRTGEGEQWKASREWPGYDINDTYYGLPRTLEKLYRDHEEAIKATLDTRPMPELKQMELVP